MEIRYGRKRLTFANGTARLLSVSLTERARSGEDEQKFTERLIEKYGHSEGVIEMVFKDHQPDYAIITFEE